MRVVVPGVAAACLLLWGCTSLKYESGGWGGGCASHSSDTTTGRIDYGVTHLTLNGRVYLVLVSAGGAGSCHAGPPASGTLRTPDGRALEWTCDTRDGRAGRVTIGAERFELDKGAVFLVNLRDGKNVVEQVAVEGAQLQGGNPEDRLKAAANSNERLAAFLKLCETPK
ncbi:MAG TPA: hypothetical protein VH092_15035 [Urbifossiella sp.]|jgi:hypothetical protein|nr:hypothetical protein [Urbifossiella sp.]